jgi:hypothetical protein
MVIDTLADEYGVYVEPAEKREKVDHIELFNNDLDARRIWLREGSELADEMQGNKWLIDSLGTERRKEDPQTANDLCDAALYGFRWCRHRQAKPESPRAPTTFSREWYLSREQEEFRRAQEVAKTAKLPGELDRDWWA